jgi:hypothetical protein
MEPPISVDKNAKADHGAADERRIQNPKTDH